MSHNDGLAHEMGKSTDTNARTFQRRQAQELMEDLRELGKGVVALYTLVCEDKFRVILTTADFQKGYEYPIKAEELNRKVLAFRDVLQNPKLDPLPIAQELYKILVGPVAKDLQGTKAQMVMWSLDGVLAQRQGAKGAARSIVQEEDRSANLPRFKIDPNAPYAHPYYWAPFILIGNWK